MFIEDKISSFFMKQKRTPVTISTEFITLGQFLKFAGVVDSGSEAKFYLATHEIYVNQELDVRRGRKLRPGDIIEVGDATYEIISQWLFRTSP